MLEICKWGSQILGCIVALLSARSKDKTKMILWLELSNFVSLLIFLAFLQWSTAITCLLINIRCLAVIFKYKFKHPNIVFTILILSHIPLLIWNYFTFKEAGSILVFLSTIASIISTFSYWYLKTKGIKIVGLVTDSMWAINDAYIKAYIATVMCLWQATTKIFYLIKYRKIE